MQLLCQQSTLGTLIALFINTKKKISIRERCRMKYLIGISSAILWSLSFAFTKQISCFFNTI